MYFNVKKKEIGFYWYLTYALRQAPSLSHLVTCHVGDMMYPKGRQGIQQHEGLTVVLMTYCS